MRTVFALAAALALTTTPTAFAQDAPGTALFKTVKEKVGADKPFSLLVSVKVKEGMAAKFEAAAAKVAVVTLKEKGCKQYDFFQSTEDAATFYLFEKWENLPALEAHFKAEHLLAFLGSLGEVLDAAPKIVVVTPLKTAK